MLRVDASDTQPDIAVLADALFAAGETVVAIDVYELAGVFFAFIFSKDNTVKQDD